MKPSHIDQDGVITRFTDEKQERMRRFSELMQKPMNQLTDGERIELTNLGAEVLMSIPPEKRMAEYSKVAARIAREFPAMRS